MPRSDINDPPTNWCPWPVTRLTDRLYYGWPQGADKPRFWHWCTTRSLWESAGTGGHDLIQREPLHLEPSLHWPECCGLHGWVRQGSWQDV